MTKKDTRDPETIFIIIYNIASLASKIDETGR